MMCRAEGPREDGPAGRRAAEWMRPMTLRKKILVLPGPRGEDLGPVHYSLALAERLGARVFVFELRGGADGGAPLDGAYVHEAVADLVVSARRAGLDVTHHLVDEPLEDRVVEFLEREGVDVLVFGADRVEREQLQRRVGPLVSCELIQVSEKERVHFLPSKRG